LRCLQLGLHLTPHPRHLPRIGQQTRPAPCGICCRPVNEKFVGIMRVVCAVCTPLLLRAMVSGFWQDRMDQASTIPIYAFTACQCKCGSLCFEVMDYVFTSHLLVTAFVLRNSPWLALGASTLVQISAMVQADKVGPQKRNDMSHVH